MERDGGGCYHSRLLLAGFLFCGSQPECEGNVKIIAELSVVSVQPATSNV